MTSARNRLRSCLYGPLLAGAVVSPSVALAEEIKAEFSGFASFVAAQTITSNQGDLDDISTDLQLNDFNVLGLRLDVDLMYNLDFTVQIRASGDSYNPAEGASGGKKSAYAPEVDWLYVGYNVTPEIRINVGKTRLPLYIYSDVLDVGYAYQWITPPFAIYGVPSLRSNEGIEFHYTTDLGSDWYSDFSAWYGQSNEQLSELEYADFEMRDAFGAKWAVENDWLTLRATFYTGISNYSDMEVVLNRSNGVDPSVLQSIAGLNFYAASLGLNPLLDQAALADTLLWDDVRTDFYGLGTMMDFGTVFIVAEATAIRLDKTAARGNLNSFYVMTGFRVTDDWTISGTYTLDDNNENKDVGKAVGKQLAALKGQSRADDPATVDVNESINGALLNGAVALFEGEVLDAIKEFHVRQKDTFILTARYDFHPNAAFKAEYLMQNVQAYGQSSDSRPQALRLGLDLVF
ncbi:Uncharacterised protein [BD1-7 clade bacterium]|uniref:Porin domain-containing protein n=1 Tax=BD1-7 clade bacterium TaxID=2029982 RepID=A0A5S9Q5I4_9GAMM|nr:Uncharacterised protein [BD1-7 clade bacterium]CAA0112296.1 Uncharacterised protein [BD1-7 clade bacterium]